MKVLYDNDVIPIGKYKGQTVTEIMTTNPTYLAKFKYTNFAIADIVLQEINVGLRNRGRQLGFIGTKGNRV